MLYLLHFSKRYFHARHYLGFTKYQDVMVRVKQHKQGKGANLTRTVVAAGIQIRLVSVFDGDRADERRLKRRKNGPRLCPICAKKRK